MERNEAQEQQSLSSSRPEITLRPFDLSDVDDFFVWASDDKVSRWCTWDTYTDVAELRKYMQDTALPHPWFRAICLAGRPVRAISVSPAAGSGDRCRGEMGYALASRHWGQGVATAAVRLALRSVFAELEGLQRVEALADVENAASQRVLEKAGFVREGVMRKYCVIKGKSRDRVMYSFISTDRLPRDWCLIDKDG